MLLILIKQNLRYTLYFSVIRYFENILDSVDEDLFDKLFFIDIYRPCFILLLLLLLLLLSVIVIAFS